MPLNSKSCTYMAFIGKWCIICSISPIWCSHTFICELKQRCCHAPLLLGMIFLLQPFRFQLFLCIRNFINQGSTELWHCRKLDELNFSAILCQKLLPNLQTDLEMPNLGKYYYFPTSDLTIKINQSTRLKLINYLKKIGSEIGK